MAIQNYTKNGEITFDTETGEYTVWNEVYTDPVCVTHYPKIAESALETYAEVYLDGEICDEGPLQVQEFKQQIARDYGLEADITDQIMERCICFLVKSVFSVPVEVTPSGFSLETPSKVKVVFYDTKGRGPDDPDYGADQEPVRSDNWELQVEGVPSIQVSRLAIPLLEYNNHRVLRLILEMLLVSPGAVETMLRKFSSKESTETDTSQKAKARIIEHLGAQQPVS